MLPSSRSPAPSRLRPSDALPILVLALSCGCAHSPSPTPAPPDGDPLAPLAWLVGAWTEPEPSGTEPAMEEHWTPIAGATMLGVNRTVRGDRTIGFEFLRIEARDEDAIVYVAQPQGRSPGTEFRLTELAENRAVFENPTHDFPQRLAYTREADTLTVEVTAKDEDGNSRGFTLRWQRASHR